MTRPLVSGMGLGMFRRSLLVFWMLMLSLTTAATIHASELPGAAVIECSSLIHSDGDADETQGDAGKAMQHHGHCHAATALLPVRETATAIEPALAASPYFVTDDVLDRWRSGPGLRPPIA